MDLVSTADIWKAEFFYIIKKKLCSFESSQLTLDCKKSFKTFVKLSNRNLMDKFLSYLSL